jgi:GT2 family glycosyltransferase
MYKTAIIILNWNSTEDTLNCLKSLKGDYDIIVVDNGSKEPPKLPDNIHLILNDKNYGFSAGNNQGIRYAIEHFNPEYILLLNSDTITTPNFLEPLITLMHSDPNIAAVQPKILRLDGQGRSLTIIDSAGQVAYIYGSVRDTGIGKPDGPRHQKRKEIFGACAAAVLYRVSALKEVGLFDEKLFCLFEDVDLSWRLRLKGYKIIFEPDSVVYHKRGVSGKIRRENKIIRRFYGFRNCLVVTIRYYPLHYIILSLPIHLYRLMTALYFKFRYRINAPFFSLIFNELKRRGFA